MERSSRGPNPTPLGRDNNLASIVPWELAGDKSLPCLLLASPEDDGLGFRGAGVGDPTRDSDFEDWDGEEREDDDGEVDLDLDLFLFRSAICNIGRRQRQQSVL